MTVFGAQPTIIGHRGAGKGEDENTIESYVAAARQGVSWIEIDVARTADDELVVHHDPVTGDGAFIVSQAASATKLPRLAEVFEALPPGVAIDIDVKTVLEDAVDEPSRRTGALLVPALRAEALRRQLLVTSFDAAVLVQVKEQLPAVPAGLLTWKDYPLRQAIATAAGLGLDVIGAHTGSFGPNKIEPGPVHHTPGHSIELAHQAGLEVMVWCPGPGEVPRFAQAGADALCVNDIPGVLAAL